jgi:hypothetical protein
LPSANPEEVVRARAQARWDALIAGRWEQAYSYATPAYRAAVDLYGFRSKLDKLIKRKSAEVTSVTCEESALCKVKIRLRFAVQLDDMGDITTVFEERWVAESGEWWRYESF